MVEALERWAAGEAARIMVGVVGVAALLTLLAIVPALALDRGRRMLPAGETDAMGSERSADGRRGPDGPVGSTDGRDERTDPSLAL